MAETILNTDITLYDINKQAMSQEEPLDPIAFNVITSDLIDRMFAHDTEYWMLLCHERRDYTVFHNLTKEKTLKEMRPTLQNRGEVLTIDEAENGAFEIWIRDPNTKENFVYYLFDYSYGVIEA